MTIVVDKKLTKQERDEILKKMEPRIKPFDAKKYFGKIKIQGDPLEIQRQMRDE
jgi:hypothetical protein